MKPPDPLEADERRALLVEQIRLAGLGDRAAMARVYAMTSAKLNSMLIRLTGDAGVAEELLQEVYLSIWRNAVTFDPSRASPITWLITIARNRAVDYLRAQRTRAATLVAYAPPDMLDPSSSVIDLHIAAEERSRLLACLAVLEARQQAAIRAAFFEGLTYEMLATRAGVPLGTMKSWIRRGLLRLAACLHEGPRP